MKYEDIVDVDKVDAEITKLHKLLNVIDTQDDTFVVHALYEAYDSILEKIIEIIGTQWSEAVLKGETP